MELHGGVALVTGGGSGIGRATAERLAAEGMQVCIVDIDGDAARRAAEPLDALALNADLSDSAQVDAAFATCVSELGGIDLVHLNAGVTMPWGDLTQVTDEAYRRMVGVNQDHVVFGARAAIRALRDRADARRGRAIVVTASLAGIEPFGHNPIYVMTKNAAVGIVRSLALALAPEEIAVHAICPSLTDTSLIEPNRATYVARGTPFMDAAEVAAAVVHAATSPIELTGTCWVVYAGQPPIAHDFAHAPGLTTNEPQRERA